MNPIIERELRARWRGLKAFGLLLAYAAPLAFAVAVAYHGAAQWRGDLGVDFARDTARAGHKVFRELAWMQILAWMLFAPTLTATTIAGERERGLLESLQLSPLGAGQIVRGKLLSALLFVGLMVIASLPVLAICFLLGGVSPAEFCQSLALSLVTATTCATIGIACSAWSRRGGTALRVTFVCILTWGILSAIAYNWGFNSSTIQRILLGILGATNPVSASFSIFDARLTGAMPASLAPYFFNTPLWLVNIALQLVAIALMLPLATRALRRPFGDERWIEMKSTPEKGRTFSKTNVWELPLMLPLRFENPVLLRELRGKFRMRVVPPWILIFEGVLGLAVAGFYLWALRTAWTQPDSRGTIWWVLAFIGLLIVMIASAMMGASGVSREREAGTWQGLVLSLLTEREILRGKIGAPLLACALFSLPLWPLLSICIHDGRKFETGASPLQVLLTFGILAATAWCYTALGLFFSSLCARSAVASGWTLAAMLIFNLLLPMTLGGYRTDDTLVLSAHPFLALVRVLSLHDNASRTIWMGENLVRALGCIVVLVVLGCVFLGLAAERLQGRARDRDDT